MKELDYLKENKKHRLVYYRYRIGYEIIDEWVRLEDERIIHGIEKKTQSIIPDFDERNLSLFPN